MMRFFHPRKKFGLPIVTGKTLFMLVCLIVVLHMSLFVYYTERNKDARASINKDLITQQVINLIERINYTKPADRQKTIKAVDIPNVTVSFTDHPLWKLQFPIDTSLWSIGQSLHQSHKNIRLSLHYGPKLWLNISAIMMQKSWWLQMFLFLLELVVVISILFSLWSINRFAKPLENFKKAADRLGVDLHAPPLAVSGPAIVKDTANAMNTLQQKVRDLIQERTNMLAALSHDLRTPITRMKLRAQFIDDQELTQKNITDLNEMEAMIAETLAFAKNNNHQSPKTKIDLNSLLATLCDDFKDVGMKVHYRSPHKRVTVLGRSIPLKRAFNNLIGNALKYGAYAKIGLDRSATEAIITIRDRGPGIPVDQQEKVFEAFYRGEQSRSRQTGGTGLGLTVARDIIRAHHGRIVLQNYREPNINESGLEVKVVFKLN